MSVKRVRRSGSGIGAMGQAAKAVVEALESRTLLSGDGLSASAGPGYAPAGTSSALAITPAVVVVSIPDANLEAAIRSALAIPTGDITDADMATLVSLDASASGVADLTGLEFATGLQSLNLSGNQITDVTPLAGLTQLTDLNLSGNQIGDVTPLAGLTQLTALNLSGNQISDVTPLAGLTQLTALNLSGNQISDVTPLAGLTQLTALDLSGNQISDVTPLAGLTQLMDLNLSGNQITDVTPLAGLTALTTVDVSMNNIDITAGSPSMDVIQAWIDAGATVTFEPQNTAPVNEAPTDIALSDNTIVMGLPAGALVGTFSTTDPNPGDTFTYALVDGEGATDNASFMIVDDQLRTAASLDAGSYSILVQTTDQGELSFEKVFTVNVTSGVSDLRGVFGLVNGKTVTSPELLDRDGDIVTLKLTGGGTGQVFGTGTGFDQIVLTGTTSKSVLTIKVKKSTGGNGEVTIGNLTSDGLIKSIKASAVIVSGPVDLNTLNTAPGKTSVSMQFLEMLDGSINAQNLPINSLKLLNWQNTDETPDTLTAPSVGSITVSGRKEKPRTLAIEFLPGDLDASVTTTGAIKSIKTAGSITSDIRSGQDAKGKGIGSITATRGISGATVATSGSINTIKVGALLGADILVGVVPDFDGRFAAAAGNFINTTAKLGTLTVTGAKLASGVSHPAYVIDSNISAPNVGTITLLNVPADTGPMVYVLTDKGVLKIKQTKLVNVPMVAVGTFKAPKTHSPLWVVVTP